MINETSTKVVHKNVSQGCNKMKKSKSKKSPQPLHKMTLCNPKGHTSF